MVKVDRNLIQRACDNYSRKYEDSRRAYTEFVAVSKATKFRLFGISFPWLNQWKMTYSRWDDLEIVEYIPETELYLYSYEEVLDSLQESLEGETLGVYLPPEHHYFVKKFCEIEL